MMCFQLLKVLLLYIILVSLLCDGWHLFRRAKKFKGCKIDLNWDMCHGNQPIILSDGPYGYELFKPAEDGLQIPYEKDIYITCPGENNRLKAENGDQVNVATCFFRKIIRIQDHTIKSKDLMCEQEVATEVWSTNRKCAQELGEEYEIGYNVANYSVPLLSVCYNKSEVRTLYSVNMLYGKSIAKAETRMLRPKFIIGPAELYPDGFDIHNTYKYPQQKQAFREQLGRAEGDMMTSKTFLARGHLASAKDFLMGTWQFSSYAYINLIPQWQSINIGHWFQMEKSIRRLANLLQEDFIIVTGTYGIMTGVNFNQENVSLYLDPDRKLLPVPDILWKIVVNQKNMSCIVFVMKNDPFSEKDPIPLCKNICEKISWPQFFIYNWRGYMYCCSYRDFKKIVSYVPKLKCKSILHNIPEPPDPFQPI